jgi:hypothetical protein
MFAFAKGLGCGVRTIESKGRGIDIRRTRCLE